MKNPSRPEKTSLDYLAAAVAPVLIILLVESLVLYLLEVGYSGPSEGRLRWTLFWFVLATVLVSRIALEIGSEHAALYGIALGVATAVVIVQYVDASAMALVLLALIWWMTSRLVRNCTVLDTDEDREAVAEDGLLSFLSPSTGSAAAEAVDRKRVSQRGAGRQITQSIGGRRRGGPWRSALRELDRPHLPGASVIYFSLVALPVFGLGELLLQEGGASKRQAAFHFVWLYVAAAIGLLLITSFLSLRRHLRRRHVPVPPGMARTWLTIGGGTALLVLMLAVLLPRPEPVYSIASLTEKMAPTEETEPGGEQEGNRSNDSAQSQMRQGEMGQAGKQGTKTSQSGQKAGKSKGSEPPDQRKSNSEAVRDSQETSGGKPQTSSDVARKIGTYIQWLFYLVLAVIAVVWLWRNRRQVMRGLRALIADLRQLLGKLRWSTGTGTGRPSGGRRKSVPEVGVFTDPFVSGYAETWSLEELLRYSFDALQAWAYERGVPRKQEQTPNEFAAMLGSRFPGIGTDAVMVADLYSQWAYGRKPPPRQATELLRRFWRSLGEG